jgi:hypothetical protein
MVMSASPPNADMCGAKMDVRFGPIADIAGLFDHRVRKRYHIGGNLKTHGFCCFEIDHKDVSRRPFDR